MSKHDKRPLKELQLQCLCADPAWMGSSLQFSARLYWKGDWVADVSNEGNGGDHTIFWKEKKAESEILAALKCLPQERELWPLALDEIQHLPAHPCASLNVDWVIDYTIPPHYYGL
ncbi:MAG: hypothetical protein RL095_2139 [Verrucomicrobiota bacterium]